MKLKLPPGVSQPTFDKALQSCAAIVGTDNVLATDQDRETYLDAFSITDGSDHAPSAAISVQSVEEVQAIVRIANEYRIPLWPISRGKNLAYGGSAPRMTGTVVLDLGRMNRILEVNAENAYCRLEPGVGFYDLYDHVQAHKLPLWVSVPKHAWGSVVGNALERGLGETSYGDHAQQICGMEVVLPSGELVRTGMGARNNSPVWNLFKYGFGPGWEQMFCQSNLGIVTKLGMWLMPQPESSVMFRCKVMEASDIEPALTAILALRRSGVVDAYMSMVSWLGIAACFAQRLEFYDGPGAMPEAQVQQIIRKFNIGWWNFDLTVYGPREVTAARAVIIERTLAQSGRIIVERRDGHQGDGQPALPGEPAPDMMPMQFINWYGGRGGHIDFSPAMPASVAMVSKYFRDSYQKFAAVGHDYFAALHFGGRHVIAPTNIIYNRDDAAMTGRVTQLFDTLFKSATEQNLNEYRAHLSYMDPVAASFDFNDHALRRLNERVKDALDPNGIFAPGKSGIWPAAYRPRRA
jgi:4-cresol dehydrogenase (hydroxylating)